MSFPQPAIETLGGCLARDKNFATLAALAGATRQFREFCQPFLTAAENERYVVENGDSKVWKNRQGQIQRGNGQAAIIYANGDQEWWRAGNRHRDGDLPAVVVYGNQHW